MLTQLCVHMRVGRVQYKYYFFSQELSRVVLPAALFAGGVQGKSEK